MRDEAETGAERVLSVERALGLLRLVAVEGGVQMAAAGRTLGLAPSTTHRLLGSLESARFVTHGDRRGSYVPGPALFELADAREREEAQLREIGQPYLRELVQTFGEGGHIVVLRGANVRFVAGLECDRALRVGQRVGVEYPAHCVSGGKAMLATMPDDLIKVIYPHEDLPVRTTESCRTRILLLSQLREVRRVGYAVNLGGSEPDVHGVGAAIVDTQGRARGGIIMGGPASRMPAADMAFMAPAIRDAAAAIGTRLSG